MYLPITLASAAVAALIAIWLMVRIGEVRRREKIIHGDGGNALLGRRMRAQLNFVESAPIVLLLIAAIELAGRDGLWLVLMAALYWLGRVLHGVGMDADAGGKARMAGTIITMVTLLVLAIVAMLLATGLLRPLVETPFAVVV
jgi:uncharacterized membrane protein YecN with MAPEG domain